MIILSHVRSRLAHISLFIYHHLICKTCGKVLPFYDDLLEELERRIEDETGFHVLDHELKFYGQCRECRNRQK